MSTCGTEPTLDNHYKEWPKTFSTRRKFDGDYSYVKSLTNLPKVGGTLDTFLVEYEGGVPSCRTQEVKTFCLDAASNSPQTKKPRIWLNDCQHSPERFRDHDRWLTSDQLHTLLSCQRSGLPGVPDADRRLLYIPDMCPKDIEALAETAPFHLVETLRDAIWKHIALQTTIRVKLPNLGYPIFRLEFHLPYSVLRELSTPLSSHFVPGTSDKFRINWRDLSFLRGQSTKKAGQTTLATQDAHICLAVCGIDHTRWNCYAFVDTKFRDELAGQKDEDEDDDENDENTDDEDAPGLEPHDPIAADSDGVTIFADKPIWDPREYFLRNVDTRMKQVLREWRHLVQNVKTSVENYTKSHSVASIHHARHDQFRGFKEELEWIVQTGDLLKHIRRRLSQSIKAWDRFDAPRGDICYFSDLLSKPRITTSLCAIRESFESLKEIEQTVFYLDEWRIENKRKMLKLRMGLESYQVNSENHQQIRFGQEQNQRTIKLNQEGLDISRKTSGVATESHRISQVALSMNMIVSSIAIAVAIFSTQQETLQFERTPRNLAFSSIVSILVLCGAAYLNGVAREQAWASKLVLKMRNLRTAKTQDGKLSLSPRFET
ncbi:hypothetical protein K504DRAFT_447157 [Pleomassaria siparia CBS 279.74]|uniref:Uncharacterized protein n=1 Tax=Pleomassaria siparia CBS 279.74 TaxID=1314801 RepID=A0A6G1K3V5_9PLEO|nr:hypothetical protein K504DRAFT_447157 [Pleomassaria siparia CBS 279.74]